MFERWWAQHVVTLYCPELVMPFIMYEINGGFRAIFSLLALTYREAVYTN